MGNVSARARAVMRRASGLQEGPAGAGMDYSLKEVVAVGAVEAAASQAAVPEQTLRATGAQVLAAEPLDQVLVAMDGAQPAFHLGFRRETVAALATGGERRVRRGSDRLPYGLQVYGERVARCERGLRESTDAEKGVVLAVGVEPTWDHYGFDRL